MLLYCIRHGESSFNAEGRIQGHLDVPLSELGLRQSEALAASMAGLPIEALYCSPLVRARQTAEPISRELGLEVRIEPRLIEINVGIFQGKSRPELDELWPDQRARWKSGDPDFVMTGGESRRALMARGQAVLEEIAGGPFRHVVVVSHGAILAGALKALLGVPADRYPFLLENASLSKIEIGGPVVRLHSLNQVDHLKEVGLAGGGDL